MSYCKYVKNLNADNVHKIYHDKHYGVMIGDGFNEEEADNEIFGRLILEINQAGLSWDTILKKEKNFKKAYDKYSIKEIAKYTESDVARLTNDAGIIRNRLKINAAIHIANIILDLMLENKKVSFKDWLIYNKENNLYTDKLSAAKYFKKSGLKFVGGEIVGEFLMSLGLIDGGHDADCPAPYGAGLLK